jgi:hypothetical protein
MVSKLGQLLITLTATIVHGHGNETFAQYFNELWPMIQISQLGHFYIVSYPWKGAS